MNSIEKKHIELFDRILEAIFGDNKSKALDIMRSAYKKDYPYENLAIVGKRGSGKTIFLNTLKTLSCVKTLEIRTFSDNEEMEVLGSLKEEEKLKTSGELRNFLDSKQHDIPEGYDSLIDFFIKTAKDHIFCSREKIIYVETIQKSRFCTNEYIEQVKEGFKLLTDDEETQEELLEKVIINKNGMLVIVDEITKDGNIFIAASEENKNNIPFHAVDHFTTIDEQIKKALN